MSCALAQESPSVVKSKQPISVVQRQSGNVEDYLTPEYYANWGLNLHNFAAAYAAGATGQGVILGQLDSALWSDHPEMLGINLRSFEGTRPKHSGSIDEDGLVEYHGQHVGGIIVARRDGKGMHGGAFGATTYFNAHYNDRPSATSIQNSGASFVNHSYGTNLANYRRQVVRDGEVIGHASDTLRHVSLNSSLSSAHQSSLTGTVNVNSAGNDRYYATALGTNRYDARPRLFRGLPVRRGISAAVAGTASNRGTYNDTQWRAIEKNTIVAVNLNGTGEISSYSNSCSIAKYYCIGAAGGMLAEPHQDYLVELPYLGLPVDYYYPNDTGRAYKYEELGREIWASQYRILSLASTTSASSDASAEEKLANLEATYRMAFGTSMAAPTLTAGLGVTKSRFPYLENWQVRDVVLTTARDMGAPGVDRVYGWGSMDLATAMGGPCKLFALKRSYIAQNIDRADGQKNLYDYEIEQADLYEVIVAKADVYANRAYELKVQIIELKKATDAALAELATPELSDSRRSELQSLVETNTQTIKALEPQEKAARDKAYEMELTRIQPNLEGDTEEAAFESIIWDVNLPGERTAECDSDFCIADYWTNDIDGPGGLNKLGKGTLALAGTNTYQGGTTVTAGALQFGLGGETGSVEGDIVNNSSIFVVRSNEWEYDGIISGTGELNILSQGGGLRLSNTHTYTGDTNIVSGELAVDGSIVSNTTIFDGGILTGSGQVANVSAQRGAFVAAGIGAQNQLVVNGDISFNEGSTLLALYDSQTANKLVVNGKLTSADANISFLSTAETQEQYEDDIISLIDQPRVILSTSEVLEDGFFVSGLEETKRFIDPLVNQDDHTISFGYTRNSVAFDDLAKTSNQATFGRAIEEAGEENYLHRKMLVADINDDLSSSLHSLTGENHANTTSYLASASRQVVDAVGNRMRSGHGISSAGSQVAIQPNAYANAKSKPGSDAFNSFVPRDNGVTLWGEVFKSWTTFDGDQSASGFKGDSAGLISGGDIDYQADGYDARVGLFGGYRSSSVNSGAGGNTNVDTYVLGLYSGFSIDAYRLSFGASYNLHEITSNRTASIGTFNERHNAIYDGSSYDVFAEAGYSFSALNAQLETFAGLRHVGVKTDGFAESGSVSNLSGSTSPFDSTLSTLGIRGETTFDLESDMSLSARGMVAWAHNFGDVQPQGIYTLNGVDSLSISGAALDRDSLLLEAGLDLNITPTSSLGLSYQGSLSANATENAVKASYRLRF